MLTDAQLIAQFRGKELHRALAWFARTNSIDDEFKWLSACLNSVKRAVPELLPVYGTESFEDYQVEREISVGAFRGYIDLVYPWRTTPLIVDWKLAASAYAFRRDLDRWEQSKGALDMLRDHDKYRAALAEQALFYSVWLWLMRGESEEVGVEFHFVAIECPDDVADRENVHVEDSGWYFSPASLREALEPVLEQRSISHPTYYKQRPGSW